MSAARLHTTAAFFILSAGVGIMSRRITGRAESEAEPGESWELIDSGEIDLVIYLVYLLS